MDDEYGGFSDGLRLGGGAGVERDQWGVPVDPIYDNYGHFKNNSEGGGDDNGGGFRPRRHRDEWGCFGDLLAFIGVGCLFFFGATVAFIMELYGAYVVTFYTPTEYDFVNEYYKMAAAESAEELLTQAQREKWENYGLTVITKGQRSMIWGFIDHMITDKSWRGYEGKKIAYVFNSPKSIRYIDNLVSYEGDHTYRVKANIDTCFNAIAVDGKNMTQCGESKSEYIVTIKCNPERKWYGLMDMGWELLDIETRKASISEEEIMEKVNNTPIPPAYETIKKENAKKTYEEKMKNQKAL